MGSLYQAPPHYRQQPVVLKVTRFAPENWLDTIKVVNDAPVPKPGPGEVLLNVKLRPINPADIFSIQGVYPAFHPTSFPCVPGMEGMGVVAALGPGVTSLKEGQRVTAALWPKFGEGQGLYQEYVTVPADALTVVPDDIPDDAAACAVINPVTALGMMELVEPVPQGDYLLITAAGAAVSRMLLSLCKERGIKTIGVVRRREQVDEMLQAGQDAVVCTADEDLIKRVMEITGNKGAHAAFDCMCGDHTSVIIRAVRIGGKVVQYGAMLGPTFTCSVADTFFRASILQGYWCNIELQAMTAEQRKQRMQQIFDAIRRGVIQSGAGKTYPLAQALEALKAHTEVGRAGKIMLSS